MAVQLAVTGGIGIPGEDAEAHRPKLDRGVGEIGYDESRSPLYRALWSCCVQNGVQLAPTVPHKAAFYPLYIIDSALAEQLTPASQAGCHGFDPRLPLQFFSSHNKQF